MIIFNREKQKGSTLAFVLVIMTAVMIILVSMLSYITAQLKFSYSRVERDQAFQIAEAGVYYYRWYLAHQISGKTAQQIKDFWQTGNPYGVASPYQADYFDPEGGKIGSYKIEVIPPDPNSTIVIVKSTGWTNKAPNLKRIIQVRFRRPAWSEYSVLANDFIRFGEGTEVFGEIHSNEGIRFDGLAHNIVSSSVASYDDPDHTGGLEFGVHTHVNVPPATGVNNTFRSAEAPPNSVPLRSDVFLGGRQFPTPTIDFNGVVSDLSYMKTESQISGQGLYFDNNKSTANCNIATKNNYGRHIVLKNDGTMSVSIVTSYDTTTNSIKSETCANALLVPNNGIIFVENNLWLEGSVNSEKITLVAADLLGGSAKNVYLGMNNLLYTNFDGRDIIGVIAQNNVEIIKNSQNYLTLDGAFLAQLGRVGRADYGTSDYKNTITINGSIATNLRYGFAWTNGYQNWGYANRILNFDNNLLYYPPPYFPTGTEYAIDLWEEI